MLYKDKLFKLQENGRNQLEFIVLLKLLRSSDNVEILKTGALKNRS